MADLQQTHGTTYKSAEQTPGPSDNRHKTPGLMNKH